jgi:predicted nucleic acid-binding Zn ribbon protein
MEKLIKTLPAILQAAGDSAEVAEAACMAAWKHAAGDGLRDHAVPLRLNEKTLVVGVADSTWRQQMQSLSRQLLFRLNDILGHSLVTALEFRVEPERLASLRGRQDARSGREQVSFDAVPFELVTAAARIQDKDLRRVFLGAAMSCLKRVEERQPEI